MVNHPFLKDRCLPKDLVNLIVRAREAALNHPDEDDYDDL